MPIARFHPQPGAEYRLDVREDQAGALLPHTSGISIPLEGGPLTAGGGRLTWDISYLYAELWSLPEDGRQLIGVALAEFTTDSQRPTAVRVPLTPNEVAMIEDLRRGGDVRLLLHLQARSWAPYRGTRCPIQAGGRPWRRLDWRTTSSARCAATTTCLSGSTSGRGRRRFCPNGAG